MKNNIVRLILILIYSFVFTYADSTTDRINGVAQFLIDRANDNYLYIFEKKIKENKDLACFFTNTVHNLEIAGLKELLYSHQLWEESLKKDLDILATRSVVSSIEKSFHVGSLASKIASKYAVLTMHLQIEYNGQFYDVNNIPLDADPELKNLLNGFYIDMADITQAVARFKDYNKSNLCNTPALDFATFKREVDALFNLDSKLKSLFQHFDNNKEKIIFKSNALVSLGNLLNINITDEANIKTETVNILKSSTNEVVALYNSEETNQNINAIKNILEVFSNDEYNMTVKVVQALKEIQKSSMIEESSFSQMKKYILFFAQISDAKSSEQVNEILKAYTLPSISFFEKRKYGEHWLINSYLGIQAAKSNASDIDNEKDWFGVMAPIGFEYCYGFNSGSSLSLTIAPFDLGFPVTLKLNGTVEEVKLGDIIAPSLILTYGFPEYPLAIGGGYQRGRRISSGNTEEKIFLLVSFDMPLWILK